MLSLVVCCQLFSIAMDKLNKNSISANNYVDSSGNTVVLENYIECESEKNRLNQDCKKSFESKKPLNSNTKFVKFPFCERPCSSGDFKMHVAQNHQNYPLNISAKNTKARAYVCFICKARYSDKDECRQHMLSHKEKNGTYTNGPTYQEITQKVDSRNSTPTKTMEIENTTGDRCKHDIASAERTNVKGSAEYVNRRRSSRTFHCGTCRSKFLYYHQLANHLKIGSCNKVIENKSALIEYKRIIHPKSVCSLCLFCQITFHSEYQVSKHISQHHSSFLIQIVNQQEQKLLESITSMFYISNSTVNSSTIRYNCILCGMGDSIEICVREHILEHHSNKVLDKVEQQCKSVEPLVYMFYSSQPVNDSSTPPSLGITCYLCGKIYSSKDEFKQHLMSHTEEEKCCNECGRHLKASKIMCVNRIAHEKSLVHEFSKILKCPICKSGICGEKCFKTHLSKKHSTFTLTPAPAKNFIIRCAICATSFSNKDDQDKHMANHKKKRLFLCIGCGITFHTVWKLSQHNMACANKKMREDSCELTNLPFNCPYVFSCHECLKIFTAKTDLEIHLIMHKNLSATILSDSAKEQEENHDLDSYLDLSPQTKTAKNKLKTEQYDIAVPGDQVSINVKQEIDDGIIDALPFVKQEVLDDDGVNVDDMDTI